MSKLFLATGLILIMTSTALGQTKNFIDQPYIEVGGYADTLITPNQIFIKISISERDSKDKISIEELETKMIAALKALNINTDKDLAISDLLSNYRFHLLKQKDILKSKEYLLKVTDASTAGKVFIQLEDIGISNASINRVDHTELEKINNICRTKAIENAKTRAIALTKPLMQTVGNAIYIAEGETTFENQLRARMAEFSMRDSRTSDYQKYEEPKVEFEKIRVKVNVVVNFILK